MCTNFCHLSFIYDYYLIGVSYGTKSMSNNNNGAVFVEAVKVLYNFSLVICVKRVGRLIKKYEIWILVYSPSYQYSLFLSLA